MAWPGHTDDSHAATSGVSVSKLAPARSHSSSSGSSSCSASPSPSRRRTGTTRRPREARARPSNLCHMNGRPSRSTATMVAPRDSSVAVGPISAPAPMTAKTWPARAVARRPLAPSTEAARTAAAADGSMTPCRAHASACATNEAPLSTFPLYGMLSDGAGASARAPPPSSTAVAKARGIGSSIASRSRAGAALAAAPGRVKVKQSYTKSRPARAARVAASALVAHAVTWSTKCLA
mmetsp:Transcript_11395/g.39763  ORF Transcript_11395/g.39763 Transcript_11395/m.39763 type:complete len:236 (-) Transcript_11395:354-1061(-)